MAEIAADPSQAVLDDTDWQPPAGLRMQVAYHAHLWFETRNPFHIDAAVVLCADAGAEMPAALTRLAVEVARLRIAGETRAGTPDEIKRGAAKDFALTFMARLCAAGLPLDFASRKAAAQLQQSVFGATYKASSLEKMYGKHMRALEAEFRDRMDAEQISAVLHSAEALADPPADLIGERR